MATSSVGEAPILIVAAMGRELAGLNREPSLGLELLETGEGIANAGRNLEAWLERASAHAVLSIGFAGALSASLQVGDLVIAQQVRGSEGNPDGKLLSAAGRVQMSGRQPRFGVALTSNDVLCRAESKRALASSLAANEIGFVDTESTAIAVVCSARGLPFLIARSITDLLDEDLPLDFNQLRDRDGRVDPRKVAKAALLRPAAVPGLFELWKRSRLCAERMGDFVWRLLPLISELARAEAPRVG